MKFEELLYQPVQAPLEGFDKAVATGFEIAQNQERLRQAQERLNLEKQQIQQEYLTKGIGTLSTLSKVKSQKQRKILSDMLMQYMSKGGLPFKQETVDALLSDEDTSIAFSDALVQGQKQYPGDPVLAWTKAAELANMDPDTAIDQAQKLKQAQLAAGEKRSLEEFKTEVDVRKEATKRYVEISKKPIPPQLIARSKELYPGDLGKQAEYRELYFSAVGDRIGAIRAGVRAGLPEAKKNPQKYKDLMQALVEAESQYIPNTDKSIDAVNKAEEIFGELKGAYKPKEAEAKAVKLKPLSDKQIESLATFSEIPRLINDAKKVIDKNKGYFGKISGGLQRLTSPFYQSEVSGILDGILTDIKQTVGKLKEGGVLRLEDEKKYERMLPSITDSPAVAQGKADNILRDMTSKVKTFVKTLKKAGRDVSQFEEEIGALEVPGLPEAVYKEKKTSKPSVTTEEAPQRQSQSIGTIPFSKLQERAKAKNKSIESLEKDALSQGYLIDRSR